MAKHVEPQFEHDCGACKFIGRALFDGVECDWYTCSSGKVTPRTLIARYGNRGEEYSSTDIDDAGRMVMTALGAGLDLTGPEKDRILLRLLKEHLDSLPRKSSKTVYENYGSELGNANWLKLIVG